MARPEPVFLRGAKLLLRPKLPEDAERDYAWRVDEELARLDAAEPYRGTFEDFRASYLDELAYPPPDSYRFAMVDAATGKHIGNCMSYDLDRWAKDAELGILIGDKQCWSKGYGEEAVRLLLDHLFGDLGLQRVHLQTLDWNVRAQRCFQKCGFTFCGQNRRGRLVLLLMEIPRSRWEEDRKKREGDGREGLGKPQAAQIDTPRVRDRSGDPHPPVPFSLAGRRGRKLGRTQEDTPCNPCQSPAAGLWTPSGVISVWATAFPGGA